MLRPSEACSRHCSGSVVPQSPQSGTNRHGCWKRASDKALIDWPDDRSGGDGPRMCSAVMGRSVAGRCIVLERHRSERDGRVWNEDAGSESERDANPAQIQLEARRAADPASVWNITQSSACTHWCWSTDYNVASVDRPYMVRRVTRRPNTVEDRKNSCQSHLRCR